MTHTHMPHTCQTRTFECHTHASQTEQIFTKLSTNDAFFLLRNVGTRLEACCSTSANQKYFTGTDSLWRNVSAASRLENSAAAFFTYTAGFLPGFGPGLALGVEPAAVGEERGSSSCVAAPVHNFNKPASHISFNAFLMFSACTRPFLYQA